MVCQLKDGRCLAFGVIIDRRCQLPVAHRTEPRLRAIDPEDQRPLRLRKITRLEGIDRPERHFIIIREHQLDVRPILPDDFIHLGFRLRTVPVCDRIRETIQLHTELQHPIHGALRAGDGILVSGLPLEHDILNRTIPIPVYHATLDRFRCQLPLHRAGFEGIGPHIIELIPALQIILHQLTVEKDDRYIRIPRCVDDLGRCRTVDQIYADHVEVRGDHVAHLFVLLRLTLRGIIDLQHDILLLIRLRAQHLIIQILHQRRYEGIILIIDRHADFDLPIGFSGRQLLPRTTAAEGQHHEQHDYDCTPAPFFLLHTFLPVVFHDSTTAIPTMSLLSSMASRFCVPCLCHLRQFHTSVRS